MSSRRLTGKNKRGLLLDLCDTASTDGTTTFANRETLASFHSDGLTKLDGNSDVVTRHNHLNTFWSLDDTGNVSSTEEELWTVTVEEWSVTTTFILGQDVKLSLSSGVRSDGTWLCQNLTTLNSVLVNTTKQKANIVTSHALLELLAEHFHTSNGCLLGVLHTDDLDFFTNLDHTTLDTASCNGTTTGDGEDVFNRHEERLVNFASWLSDVIVDRIHELTNSLNTFWLTFKRSSCGTANDCDVVAWVLVLGKKITNFHLNKLKELFVVEKVNLVQPNNDGWNTHLTSQQDVLASLWHRSVSSRNNEDRAVHLSGTSDHVLDEVSVTWAVNVCVVTCFGFVLNVSNRNCNSLSFVTNSTALGDIRVGLELSKALISLDLEDTSRSCCFTVVNVTDGAHVNVRLCSFECFLSHVWLELFSVERF